MSTESLKKEENVIPQGACNFIDKICTGVKRTYNMFVWLTHVIDNIHVRMSVCTILHYAPHVK